MQPPVFDGIPAKVVWTNTDRPWAELALEAGYSDQAHLTREFGELAGLSPVQFRRLSPAARLHVPVATSNFFKTVPRGGSNMKS